MTPYTWNYPKDDLLTSEINKSFYGNNHDPLIYPKDDLSTSDIDKSFYGNTHDQGQKYMLDRGVDIVI